MTEKHIEITAQESGERIDALLALHSDIRSRSQAARLLEQGLVTMNGEAVGKSRRVTAGEGFSVTIPEAAPAGVQAQEIPLDVVYEDGDVIVVNKPRGMVVHPAPGHSDGTLVNALLAHCGPSLSGVGGEMRPGIVHRIDKDTSGLIIAAKNDLAHQSLSAQLKDRSLSRIYEAVVHGPLHEDKGTVNAPIGRDPRNRQKMAVTDKNSRPAVTHWEVLTRYSRYTYIRCRLETGRTHQIRVHMAHISHPLLGDTVYGGRRDKGLETQCLHARGLKFIHPATGEPVELWTDLPDWFQTVLDKLGPPLE
ncbi:MAG: RluA family pseudouridine synthase [Oscillospiraceae bacterium]|nr:RluA family pseudouridine synthase [Oscillospiraceae bacterium]